MTRRVKTARQKRRAKPLIASKRQLIENRMNDGHESSPRLTSREEGMSAPATPVWATVIENLTPEQRALLSLRLRKKKASQVKQQSNAASIARAPRGALPL